MKFKVGDKVTVRFLESWGTAEINGVNHKGAIDSLGKGSDKYPYRVKLDDIQLLSQEEINNVGESCLRTSIVLASEQELKLIRNQHIPTKYK